MDTDTWSLEEPCEECEHGEDSAQVNIHTTFCQHYVNMVWYMRVSVWHAGVVGRRRPAIRLVMVLWFGGALHSGTALFE